MLYSSLIALCLSISDSASMQMSWLHLAWELMVKVAVLKRKVTEKRKSKGDRKQAKKTQ